MNIHQYKLHCSGCEPSKWVWIDADKVRVSVNLRSDCYEFISKCPKCGNEIINSRRAF